MPLSHHTLDLITEELRSLLIPARIQRAFGCLDLQGASDRAVVLQIRSPGHTHHLRLDPHRRWPRVHLVAQKPTQPDTPTAWTMLLRKWIHGAWITDIALSPRDRVITLDLEAVDPDWEPVDDDDQAPRVPLRLVAELVGGSPKIFLLRESGTILGATPGPLLGDRTDDPGRPYTLPAPPPELSQDTDPHDLPPLDDLPPDGSRSQALASFLDSHLGEAAADELRRALRSSLKSAARRTRRKVQNIEADLEKIEDAEEFQRRGELLQSAYGVVQRGASSVEVPDYYQEGMPLVEIPLDPAKSLQANIDRYFHQYRRYSAARQRVEDRLLSIMERLDTIEAARAEITAELPLQELQALREDLRSRRLLKKKQPRRTPGRKGAASLPPYRTFLALSGATILVGRGARHNDELTVSVARGRDLWLHARDFAGAHVVLRMEKDADPRSEDLLDAALLAAHFSRGKSDTLVDVTYTRAKHVRKPSNAPHGLVTVSGGSTLAVRPDDPRLQRLLGSENSA